MKLIIENPVSESPLISTDNIPANKVKVIMLSLVMIFKLTFLDFIMPTLLQTRTEITIHPTTSRRKKIKCQFIYILGLT